MIEMSQAEVDEAMEIANDYRDAKITGGLMGKLARAVLHLAERDRQNAAIIGLGVLAVSDAEERCAVKLAEAQAEIARLAARQMPALRWEGCFCLIGSLQVGHVQLFIDDNWIARLTTSGLWLGDFGTESEARAAVEAAVRKELGVGQIEAFPLEPNAVVHPAGDLVAVVARLERERIEDRRRIEEVQTTIAKQAEYLARHDLRPL